MMMISYRILFAILIAVLTVAGLTVAFRIFSPTPPSTVVMTTGPAGSAYQVIAEQYREMLAANGITLELRKSGGAAENLQRLREPDGEVSVGFVTMGGPDSADSSGLQSLGAMLLEPLWIFASDEELAQGQIANIASKQLSIGPRGSRSHKAARGLLGLLGVDADLPTLHAYEPRTAAAKLRQGELDAMFLVSNSATPLVQELLSDPNLGLVNFARAAAYTARFPELRKLVVPAGVADLARGLPPEDVNILAFTTILAIREDLHPAVQSLLLDAAHQIHSQPDLFHETARFPQPTTKNIPLSDTASRYFTSGPSFLQRHLPFWLAVLLVQFLVAALPLVGLVYPALKLMPKAYEWAMRRRIFRIYRELRRCDSRLAVAATEDDVAAVARDLEELDRRARELRVPVTFSNLIYALRGHINVVRSRTSRGIGG